MPGYEASGPFGLGAPKDTPPAILEKLNKEMNAVLADPKAEAQLCRPRQRAARRHARRDQPACLADGIRQVGKGDQGRQHKSRMKIAEIRFAAKQKIFWEDRRWSDNAQFLHLAVGATAAAVRIALRFRAGLSVARHHHDRAFAAGGPTDTIARILAERMRLRSARPSSSKT